MALNKTTLATAIELAYKKQSDKKVDPEKARKEIANDIANAIDLYVKSATVSTIVATTGTAVAQTGTGTGTLS